MSRNPLIHRHPISAFLITRSYSSLTTSRVACLRPDLPAPCPPHPSPWTNHPLILIYYENSCRLSCQTPPRSISNLASNHHIQHGNSSPHAVKPTHGLLPNHVARTLPYLFPPCPQSFTMASSHPRLPDLTTSASPANRRVFFFPFSPSNVPTNAHHTPR